MWSHYDDFAVGETNKLSSSATTRNHNINNSSSNNGAIPYHARENSLPFSYGQISKTSTPLRPTTTSSTFTSRNYNKNVNELDFDFGLNSTGRINPDSLVGGYEYGYGNSALNGSYGGKYGIYNNNNNTSILNETNIGSGSSDRKNNKRQNYIYDDLNSSEKYLNEICTQSVKYGGSSNSDNNYINNNNNHNNNNNNNNNISETDASMIKAQPRLTSPLLVRKTLSNGSNSNSHINSSRSPTRSTTNTIANTYHYSYGNANNSNKNGSFIGDNNFDKFGLNGNINSNDNYGHKTMYGAAGGSGGGGSGGVGDTVTKTPARHDFDELLRERREKVFNEYRSTTHDLTNVTSSSITPKASPVPPPRRFANGTVQLPSTLPTYLNQKSSSSSQFPPQIPNRSQSQNSRYNYDIEFNLNLNERYADDEVDNVDILRRRTNTIDSLPQRPQPQYIQQQKQQLYQTRDIPLASTSSSSSYVERNYHTISSSSALTHAKNSVNNDNNNREALSPTSMLDIYATPYDERKIKRTNLLQTLEATPPASATTTLQRAQRSTEYSTYGNGNMYGHEHANLGQSMTDRESSPIYATSTKKGTTNSNSSNNNTTTLYRNTTASTLPLSSPSFSASTITLTVADYPSPNSARPETPAFPVTPRTPFASSIGISGPNGYTSQTTTILNRQTNGNYQQHLQTPHQQQSSNAVAVEQNYTMETIYGTNYRSRLNSSLSMANSEPQEVAAHLVKFAKDSSKFWYKPNLSREEAISLLINAAPGTFVVRDSTTYKNAYGLVLRVAQPPPGTTSTGKPDELVRHFLIEPTTRGVRLKGCANEPVFTSLSALVYEHSINQLALPCLLHIPERDLVPPLVEPTPAQKQLMTQGAACNVLWLFSCDTESLTGEEAIRKAIRQMYALPTPPTPTEVHFKVTQQGITLTDNTRKKFFRKHYTADIISYCAIDPDHRLWSMQEHGNDNTTVVGSLKKTIFAFVARRSASSKDNQCHIFCDLAINQPASAIVSFVNKTLPTEKQNNYVL